VNDLEAVTAIFEADLPETLRILNVGTITEEIIFGRDVSIDEDQAPGQDFYDHYRAVAEQLVTNGVLLKDNAMGFEVYGLTPEHQERLRDKVLRYLDQSAKRARTIEALKQMNAYEAAAEALRETWEKAAAEA